MRSRTVSVADLATSDLEPITREEAKKQCEIGLDDPAHDEHIDALTTLAREIVEDDTMTLLVSRTVTEKFPYFPDCFELRYRPVSSITSITYYDSSNALQTWSSSNYQSDLTQGEIYYAYNATLPSTYDRLDAVIVTYVAGYSSQSTVPEKFKQMMKLQLAYAFERRNMTENEAVGGGQRAYETLARRYMRSTYP